MYEPASFIGVYEVLWTRHTRTPRAMIRSAATSNRTRAGERLTPGAYLVNTEHLGAVPGARSRAAGPDPLSARVLLRLRCQVRRGAASAVLPPGAGDDLVVARGAG